jgi:hypothetical protein
LAVAFLPLNVSAAQVEAQDFYLSDLKPHSTSIQESNLQPHLTTTIHGSDLKPQATLTFQEYIRR